ncbi:MAG: hypothetical protein LKE29_10865 [Acidaminococcaceae bacterium]|jgi:exopolyphosphatase/guanosine-5'-triphosphate,3'-diphosphate pyrophosphatase|nr:hypothetical protein [Acidaminococcaceae bacterium]
MIFIEHNRKIKLNIKTINNRGTNEKVLLPRWEWRSFVDKFDEFRNFIAAKPLGNKKFDVDMYLIGKLDNYNVKIRNNAIDVKELKEIDATGLEKWTPILKVKFPLQYSEVALICKYLGVLNICLKQKKYAKDEFFKVLFHTENTVDHVKVEKERKIYVVDNCIIEFTKAYINKVRYNTVCIESEKPFNVLALRDKMQLPIDKNENYVYGLKRIIAKI